MNQVRAARLVATTDLRRRVRSRTFLLTAVVGPIVLATIISLAFGDDVDATIGVVDDDRSDISERFVDGLTAAEADGLTFTMLESAETARAAVDDGDVGAAIVVPAGFADSLQSDAPGDLAVVTASGGVVAAEVARAVATTFTDRANAARLAAAASVAANGTVPDPDVLAGIELPVQVTNRGTGGAVSPAAYFGPSMGLLFLFLSTSAIARGLLAERRTGLLDRVRAGPVGDAAILSGKAAGVVVVGASSLLVIWAVTSLALGAEWGDPIGVAAIVVAAAIAVAGVAGLIAALAPTEQAADNLGTAVGFLFALVGGAFIPPGDLPEAFQNLTVLTPTGVGLRGFAELSAGGGDAASVAPHVLVLLAWGLVTGVVAARLLPRRLGAG